MNGPPSQSLASPRAVVDSLIEALGSATAILDGHFRVVVANRRLLQFLATDADSAVGRELGLLDNQLSHDCLRDAMSAAGSGAARWELTCEMGALGRRSVVFHAARLTGPPRAFGKVLLTIEDLPGLDALTASAQGLSAAMPSPVGGKNRVLAAAMHDLRQPLQAMTLIGSLLARRVKDPDALALVRRLEDTIAAMSGTLTTMLDISRWDAESARAQPVNFSMNDLFDRLRTEFAGPMQQHDVRWQVIGCRQTVHSDPRLLAQMLRNMVRYGLDHSDGGRMLLGARRHRQRVRIELWDAGSMAAEADPQIVYDALRPNGSRAPAPNAALVPGLAMVRRIADLLGHRIDLGFTPGRGSVFSIEVPLAVAMRPAIPVASRALVAPDPDRVVRGTVFVIDDDADVRETMRDLLDATGWATEIFSSSEEFLRDDRPARTGCLLVDALLPGMGGVELLRLLKERRHRLPAIVLTGAGDVRMAVEAMAAGALNFIEKPVRYEELLPNIERAFDLLADSSKIGTWREQAVQRAASLTARQRQILDMVLAGKPSRNIAADLGVSRRTIENHRAVIMKKLGAESIPQLIRVGIAAS